MTTQNLNRSFKEFLQNLSEKYKINIHLLQEALIQNKSLEFIEKSHSSSSPKSSSLPSIPSSSSLPSIPSSSSLPSSPRPLSSMTIVELKALCKSKNLTVSGTKKDLISRLENPVEKKKGLNKNDEKWFLKAEKNIQMEKSEKKQKEDSISELKKKCQAKNLKVSGTKSELLARLENPQDGDSSKSRKKKCLFKPPSVSKVIEKLRAKASSLSVRKNEKGFYVHTETNLVFDPKTQKVIGKWKDDQVKWLSSEDIQVCKEYQIFYEIPENLNFGVNKIIDQKVTEVLGEDDFKQDEYVEEEDEIEEDDEY